MSILFVDPDVAGRMIRERRELGLDRHDEVWDGIYVVSPLPNDEHQEIVLNLGACFLAVVNPRLDKVRPGVNVSDRDEGWEHNFRGPDVVVFLKDTKAINRGTHWVGGPDFAVEVVSRYDESRKKLDFYAGVNTRELLLVDCYPWSLELYRLIDGKLVLVGKSTIDDPILIRSEVLPLSFRLAEGEDRPMIEIAHHDGDRRWSALDVASTSSWRSSHSSASFLLWTSRSSWAS